MAGTVTIATRDGARGLLECFNISWTSDGDGNATLTTTEIEGTIERIVFNPSLTSGEQPTNAYDVMLLDRDGLDVLNGKGANLANTGAVEFTSNMEDDSTPPLPFATCGALDLAVSGAGDTKSGTIRLFVRR